MSNGLLQLSARRPRSGTCTSSGSGGVAVVGSSSRSYRSKKAQSRWWYAVRSTSARATSDGGRVARDLQPLHQDRVHLVAPLVQVLAERRLAQAGVQQHERLLDLADLGRVLFQLAVERLEGTGGLSADRGDGRIDRRGAAEVRRPGDAQVAQDRLGRQRRVGFSTIVSHSSPVDGRLSGSRGSGPAIAANISAASADGPGDRAVHREAAPAGGVRHPRHPPLRRLEADDAAPGGRLADRGGQVAALGQRPEPGRHGRRRPAR